MLHFPFPLFPLRISLHIALLFVLGTHRISLFTFIFLPSCSCMLVYHTTHLLHSRTFIAACVRFVYVR